MSGSSHSCPIIHANCPTGALTLPYGVWATANDCVGWPSTMHYVLNLNLIYTSTIISHIRMSVGMQSFQTTLKLSDQPESGTYSLLYLIATFYTILVQGKCSHPFYTHTHSTDSFASLQLNSQTLLVVSVAREEAVRLMPTAFPQVSVMSALIL